MFQVNNVVAVAIKVVLDVIYFATFITLDWICRGYVFATLVVGSAKVFNTPTCLFYFLGVIFLL